MADYLSNTAANRIWGNNGLGAFLLHNTDESAFPSYGPRDRRLGLSLRCLGSGGNDHANAVLDP